MIKPDPPASLADTREAVERMDARGNTLVPVDREQVEAVVRDLIDSGVESLTVSLINAYVDGRHEREIAEIIESIHPGFPVTVSSDVLPEFREYERTLTACMNSYVRPTVSAYVDRLQIVAERARRAERGRHPALRRRRDDAGRGRAQPGLRRAERARAAASPARSTWPTRAGYPNILTFDMGGTSTDVSLCQAGEPTIGRETTIGQFRIKIPSIDVHTVGAGGGSIAHVPELTGALRVGPESAGAEPGPAAYGRGGTAPTVTDANVVVGHLPPRLIGGEMELDVEAARTAVGTIAEAMGLSLEEAAEGILKIVNENMAGALRVISVQRGHDPREFALVAFGGAGPLHANAVAELMGSFPVIVPPSPGPAVRARRPRGRLPQRVRPHADPAHRGGDRRGDRRRSSRELEGRAREWMDAQGIDPTQQTVTFHADMRYHGQGYEIPVPIGDDLEERFNALHEQLYGFRMPDTASEIVNLRAVGTGDRPKPELPEGELHGPDPGRRRTRLRARAALQPGQPHLRPGGDHRVRLHDRRARGLRGRGRPLLQHPDPTGGRSHEGRRRSPT